MKHFNIPKAIFISILALVISQISLAQIPNFEWAKQMGGTLSDNSSSITIDAGGNVYTTGNFTGTADFDPGAGTTNLTSLGSEDIFIQKLDSNGNLFMGKIDGRNLQ